MIKNLLFLLITTMCFGGAFAQAPIINIPNQNFVVGTAITAVTTGNTGGAIPGGLYGQVSTFAGSNGQQGNANGTGSAARFLYPTAVATDAAGNVYECDDSQIRKITPAGVVTTIAGGSSVGTTNGSVATATFFHPAGITVDATGNIYISDTSNSLIRKITPAGEVSTFAGNGASGPSNNAAAIGFPSGIVIDAAGNVFVSDSNNSQIKKITPAGVVTIFAGNLSGAANATNGLGTAAGFNTPMGLAIDATGNLYVADSQHGMIRKITPAGLVSTLADATTSAGKISRPYGLTVDALGNVYAGDYTTTLITKITPAGVVSTFAGGGVNGADGIGTAAGFSHPIGLATDAAGNIFVADQLNSTVRKISTTGYTLSPALPAGLSFDAATGTITGTPTAASASTNYTLTAYNSSGSSSTTFTITVILAPQSITFGTLSNITYGSADVALTATASSGLAVSYVSSNTNVATIVNGKIHVVGAGSANITATQAGNTTYDVAKGVVQPLVISPAPLTVTVANKNKIYGAANPALTATYTGFVNNETVSVVTTQPTITTTAVTSSAVNTYPITATGGVATNYALSYVTATLTVTQAPLTITADSKSKVYGAANPVLTAVYTGFVNGDDANKLTALPVLATTAVTASGVNSYPITVGGAASTNYNITYVAGSLAVTPALLTITAEAKSRNYGAANPTLTATYTGFVNGDDISKLTQAPTLSTTATATSAAGSYPISVGGALSSNYSIIYITGTLTVIPIPVISSASPLIATYNTTVTITGVNFTGATAVTFGGVAASSFTVVSATSITAVVGMGGTGSVIVTTPYGTSTVTGFSYNFTLPQTNLKLSAISATCKGSANGMIKLSAVQSLSYTATLTGVSTATKAFTDTATINNLAAGTYNVCITVAGQSSYQQCYTVVITEPKDLSLYATVGTDNKTVSLALNGGTQYNIQLNGKVYSTQSSNITLPLISGKNSLVVTTDRICQGVIEKVITASDAIIPYPNPVESTLYLNIGNQKVSKAEVEIYSSMGMLVYKNQFADAINTIVLDLSTVKMPGTYTLKLTSDNSLKTFKIIKK